MKTLRETVAQARENKVSVGHFNISNLEAMWAVLLSAQPLLVPVLFVVSEG